MWDLLQSILLALLVALALVGLWHLAALTCGYKVLPMYQRSACGSQVHQLAYITEHERHQLMAAGGSGKAQPGTQGVPCYPKRKREPTIEPLDPDDPGPKDAATKIIRNRRNNARAWRRYDILSNYLSTGRELAAASMSAASLPSLAEENRSFRQTCICCTR